MKIGDIEYTRRQTVSTGVADSSARAAMTFAMGINLRPLLTRIQCFAYSAPALTGEQAVYFENGNAIPAGETAAAMRNDSRALPVWAQDFGLATNGMGIVLPFETLWWKILLPDVKLHAVSSVLAVTNYVVTLHYRFAEMTPDEIIEIAAQRAQS